MSDANKLDGLFTFTTPVVMSLSNLLEAKAFVKNGKAQGEPKFGANLILPLDHPDFPAIKELVMKIIRQRWPDKPVSELAIPFQSGDKINEKRKLDKKTALDFQTGKVVINARSKYEPRLSYIENGKIIDLETDTAKHMAKSKFYNGVEVLVQLNFVPYDPIGQNAKGGVTAYLQQVLSTNKGKKLAGASASSDVFKSYVGGVSAEDPTGGDNLNDVMGF